jgi:hypothetical protein
MSFNLKQWLQKQSANKNDVVSTEKQLRNHPLKGKVDTSVSTEKQLDSERKDSDAKTIEQRLEKVRKGSVESVTESQLEKKSSKFRTPKTYEGNVKKLEAKRLASNPIEKQKTKSISETPAGARIDKMDSGKDGIKLASLDKKAQSDQDYDFSDFDFDTSEADESSREKQVREMLMGDIDKPSDTISDDDSEIDKLLNEFDLKDISDIDEDSDEWSEIKKDLMHDKDVEQELFVEKSQVQQDFAKGEDFLVGELSFDSSDPLFHLRRGVLNKKYIEEEVISYLSKTHPEFEINGDILDWSQVNDGVVKFFASQKNNGEAQSVNEEDTQDEVLLTEGNDSIEEPPLLEDSLLGDPSVSHQAI